MRYKLLGRSGLRVSELCLGTMTFGAADWGTPEADAAAMVERFRDAEALIAFAGLAPGVRQSDQTRRAGRIGGGGTDGHLRHYLIEATVWARELPRYRPTYERVAQRRGKKIGRLVVARLLLRSIFKVLRDGLCFSGEARPKVGAVATTAPGN